MKILITALFVIIISAAFSQSKTDTVTIMYDGNWRQTETEVPAYMGHVWKQGIKWHKQDFYYPQQVLKTDGVYADRQLKIKDGIFICFHKNGSMSDSCLYAASKLEGTQFQWDEDGNQTFLGKWHKGILVDTAVWWNTEGIITAVQITDSAGDGVYRKYLSNGKTIQAEGAIVGGERSGNWFFKDAKGIIAMKVLYDHDLVISTICYNEKGELEEGKTKCFVEKPAAFKGGFDAWDSYLQIHLKYPDESAKTHSQGVARIQFNIEKDGSVSNVTMLDAPDIFLAAEAVRLVKESPKWDPAIQYNRPVIAQHIQAITFVLR